MTAPRSSKGFFVYHRCQVQGLKVCLGFEEWQVWLLLGLALRWYGTALTGSGAWRLGSEVYEQLVEMKGAGNRGGRVAFEGGMEFICGAMAALSIRRGNTRLPLEVNRMLYVRNLPFNISSEEMYDIFGKYRAIQQIRIGTNKDTRGTAFVV